MKSFGNIVLILFALSAVIGWTLVIRSVIMLFIPSIKCRNVTGCKKDDCPFRSNCSHIAYTDKERQKMEDEIKKLQ